MSGFFGVASKESCVLDLFFGVDYHSHLGTRRAGMITAGDKGFIRAIHNIENTPFRTKFDKDLDHFVGNVGIGCISDYEAQPLLLHSHLGTFALTTVGRINNIKQLEKESYENGITQFFEMSNGEVNPTELIAAMINQKSSILEGIRYVQDRVEGSMSMLVMTKEGIYAARDKMGRTPIVIAKKDTGFCATFESSAFLNLGYTHYKDMGPGEIDFITPNEITVLQDPSKNMKICSFLWVYYGYPTSTYEGVNVEAMRNHCGRLLSLRDKDITIDSVSGVPPVPGPQLWALGFTCWSDLSNFPVCDTIGRKMAGGSPSKPGKAADFYENRKFRNRKSCISGTYGRCYRLGFSEHLCRARCRSDRNGDGFLPGSLLPGSEIGKAFKEESRQHLRCPDFRQRSPGHGPGRSAGAGDLRL